jgi:hypothetical protein
MSKKQHHFVVYGVENEDGTIEFFGDDVDVYLNDGTVWNPDTQQWEVCWDAGADNWERDERISTLLYERLLKN